MNKLYENLPSYFRSTRNVMEEYREYRVDSFEEDDDTPHFFWLVKQPESIKAKVLLVAHIDTVLPPTHPRITKKKNKIMAQGLDDRLGVCIALEMFKARIDVDVLICDEEEVGNSTAQYVNGEELAQYNCIIELDRKGDDFVTYGLADDDLIEAWEGLGVKKGWGSVSDISSLKERNCGCVNLGIGYEKAHAKDSYAKTKDIDKSITLLEMFLTIHGDTHFPKHYEVPIRRYGGYSNASYLQDYRQDHLRDDFSFLPDSNGGIPIPDDIEECSYCHASLYQEEIDARTGLCENCMEDLLNESKEDVDDIDTIISNEFSDSQCQTCGTFLFSIEYNSGTGLCTSCQRKNEMKLVCEGAD